MTAERPLPTPSPAEIIELMAEFGVSESALARGDLAVRSPINGAAIAEVWSQAPADADRAIHAAHAAFQIWRTVPAPKRGELVRLFGEELRAHKAALGALWRSSPARSSKRVLAKSRK